MRWVPASWEERARWSAIVMVLALLAHSFWRHSFVRIAYAFDIPSHEIWEVEFASGKGGASVHFDFSWWNLEQESSRDDILEQGLSLYVWYGDPSYSWLYFARPEVEDYSFGKYGRQGIGWSVQGHLLFALVLLLICPLVQWMLAKRARSHERQGLCPVCGYDLRATPERCPECGLPGPANGHGKPANLTASSPRGALDDE